MAHVSRWKGALLAETGGGYYLVGNLKEPGDFADAGFEPPGEEVDAMKRPFVRLLPCRAIEQVGTVLELDVEGEEIARLLFARLVIERNGSVSERLWRLLVQPEGETGRREVPPERIDARWFGSMPGPIWNIVRETVLRCS